MHSQTDRLFNSAVERLPGPLGAALKTAELVDPCTLRFYPRWSYEQLLEKGSAAVVWLAWLVLVVRRVRVWASIPVCVIVTGTYLLSYLYLCFFPRFLSSSRRFSLSRLADSQV